MKGELNVWGVRPVAWPQCSPGAATPHWECSGPSLWWRLLSPCWSAAWLHTAAGRKAHPLFPEECCRVGKSKIRAVVINPVLLLCWASFISSPWGSCTCRWTSSWSAFSPQQTRCGAASVWGSLKLKHQSGPPADLSLCWCSTQVYHGGLWWAEMPGCIWTIRKQISRGDKS